MKIRILSGLAGLVVCFASVAAFAATPVDPAAGKVLLEKSCMACHAAKFNGDATRVFTRPDRKVKSYPQLLARVQACSLHTNTGWFPEDEANVAAYLNQKFYKFK